MPGAPKSLPAGSRNGAAARCPRNEGERVKKGTILFLIVLLAAAAGAFWAFRPGRSDKRLIHSGSIEARDVEVGSLVGGRVSRVLVEEGSAVARAQPLVEFET